MFFAEEEEVYILNKSATKLAINLVEDFREEMKGKGIPEELIEHATLGAFGKKVLVERRDKHEN